MSFNSLVSSLYSQLSNISNDHGLDHLLAMTNLSHIFSKFNGTTYEQRQIDVATHLRNMLYRHILITLNKRCYHQFLLVKGLVFADDLYPTVEWRQFGDIDIIVKPENYPSIHSALIQMGFTAQFTTDECLSRIKLEHIIYSKEHRGLPLVIEVHAAAFNPAYYYADYISLLFKRSSTYNDTDILIPCCYDRIIHMLLHFCIHLRDYILESYISHETMLFNARDLLDIALTLDKYSDCFSFNILAKYIQEIHAEVDTSISWSVFHLLFPNVELYDFVDLLGTRYDSQILKTAAYLQDRIVNASNISYFFGETLQSYFAPPIPQTTVLNASLFGHNLCSPAIKLSLSRDADRLYGTVIIKTNPVDVFNSRFKLYYFSTHAYPSVRVISFYVKDHGINILQNGANIPVSVYSFDIVSDDKWFLSFGLPIADFRIYNNCIHLNPVFEYSIISQICMFGERWTDIDLWKPIFVPTLELGEQY